MRHLRQTLKYLSENWRSELAVPCFCFVLLALVCCAASWQIRTDRQTTIANAIQNNEKFNRAFEEHVRRVLQTNEHYLELIKREYESNYRVTPATHELIREISHDPLFNQIGIYSAQGEVLASRYFFPQGTNTADMPYVKAHATADTGKAIIGRPVVGRISQKLSIHMSRRLNKADGSFAGVAVLAMDPVYFVKFYRDLNLGQHYVVRLIDPEGVVLVSSMSTEVGSVLSDPELFRWLAHDSSGSYRLAGAGAGQLLSYRKMAGFPLIVQVGFDEAGLTALYQRLNGYQTAAAGVSLFIIIYSVHLIGYSRRLRENEAQLQKSFDELMLAHEEVTAAHEQVTAAEEELRQQYNTLLRLNEQISRQNTILALMQETAFILVNKLDMEQLLETIVTQAAAIARANDAFIALPTADKAFLEVKAGIGIYGDGKIARVPVNIGLMGEVFAAGRTAIVNDFPNWYGRPKLPTAKPIYAMMAAPIFAKREVAGVFGVALCEHGRTFNAEQTSLLARLAELASLALENAALHSQLQEQLAERTKITEELVQIQAERQAVLDAIPDAMAVIDRSGQIKSCRWPHEEFGPFIERDTALAGRNIRELLPADIAGICMEYTRQAIDTGKIYGQQYAVQMRGQPRHWDVRFSRIGSDKALVMIRDVTILHQSQAKIAYLSMHDPLTQVNNRAYFEAEMAKMPHRRNCGIAFIVCDVDGLKLINDTLGHHAGDDLLCAVAMALLAALMSTDGFVARIGGDEFVVVLYNPERSGIEAAVARIRHKIDEYNAKNPQLPVSVSIGWAADFNSCEHAAEVFKQADNVMYRQKMHQSQSMRSSVVETMMKALEARDYITEGHADRIGDIAEALGQQLELPADRLADLKLLAKFHDIGKVGIPDNILNKPGKFNEAELAVMRRHCEIGCRIALASPDLAPIADWILKHHEWWDGSGYPLGIKETQIPIECRILALADAYDAMTNDRPYRQALPPAVALEEIAKCAGTQFDPELVNLFIDMIKAGNWATVLASQGESCQPLENT